MRKQHRTIRHKIITTVILASLMLALTACGKSNNNTASDTMKTYKSEDGWEVNYDTTLFEVNEQDGEIDFVYKKAESGSDLVALTFDESKKPKKVISEVTKDYDKSEVNISEGYFGADDLPCCAATFNTDDSSEADDMNESYTAVEHNGGTLLIDIIKHTEEDAEANAAMSESITDLVNSIRMTKDK